MITYEVINGIVEVKSSEDKDTKLIINGFNDEFDAVLEIVVGEKKYQTPFYFTEDDLSLRIDAFFYDDLPFDMKKFYPYEILKEEVSNFFREVYTKATNFLRLLEEEIDFDKLKLFLEERN